tara:strand:- start:369 stop:530 length:162 start_codon:yes stop_codon:yes gene_type:complete
MNSSEADDQNNKRADNKVLSDNATPIPLSALLSDELRSTITDSNCSEEDKGLA